MDSSLNAEVAGGEGLEDHAQLHFADEVSRGSLMTNPCQANIRGESMQRLFLLLHCFWYL